MGRLRIALPRVDETFPEPVRQAIIRRREVDIAGKCVCGAATHIVGGKVTTVNILHASDCPIVGRMNAALREYGLWPEDIVGEAVEIELPDDQG